MLQVYSKDTRVVLIEKTKEVCNSKCRDVLLIF